MARRTVNESSLQVGQYRWIENTAISHEPSPLDQLIAAEEGETIVLLGTQAWPYEGQDRMPHVPDPRYPEIDPDGPPTRLYVGPCMCCHGNRNPRRWCAVCAKPSGRAKPLPKDVKTKYKPDGMRGGIGA